MKVIGGFFELETGVAGQCYHPDALALTSGRGCLAMIAETVSPRRIYLPSYTCDAVLAPLIQLGVDYVFYSVTDELVPLECPRPEPGEYFLYVNYFGLHSRTVRELGHRFGERLIVDNTQAFFERGSGSGWSFNSARKFFGVPDGAYLYGPLPSRADPVPNRAVRLDHLTDRLIGNQERAYAGFLASEEAIGPTPLGISAVASRILRSVDYAKVAARRRANYALYATHLAALNELALPALRDEVPFCYPLLAGTEINKCELFAQSIFIPTLWPDSARRGLPECAFAQRFARGLLPLPVDHRYDTDDCMRVIEAVLALL